MLQSISGERFAVRHDADLPGRVELSSGTAPGPLRIVISGYRGPDLPATLTGPALQRGAGDGRLQGWRLEGAEGRFDFQAVAIDRFEERPELYAPLHRPFQLRRRDRLMVWLLLLLFRLPGGSAWLRRWHDRRG